MERNLPRWTTLIKNTLPHPRFIHSYAFVLHLIALSNIHVASTMRPVGTRMVNGVQSWWMQGKWMQTKCVLRKMQCNVVKYDEMWVSSEAGECFLSNVTRMHKMCGPRYRRLWMCLNAEGCLWWVECGWNAQKWGQWIQMNADACECSWMSNECCLGTNDCILGINDGNSGSPSSDHIPARRAGGPVGVKRDSGRSRILWWSWV